VTNPLRKHCRFPPFAECAKDGAPNLCADAREIKSLSHARAPAWNQRREQINIKTKGDGQSLP